MKIEDVEKQAKKHMEKHKEHISQMIVIKKNKGIDMYILDFNEEGKEKMKEFMRKRIQQGKIHKYFIINEAWTSQNSFVRPKEDPKRKEVLIITEYNSDITLKSRILFFERKDNQIVWGERLTNNNISNFVSSWNFFLEDVMDEHIENRRFEQAMEMVGAKNFEKDVDKGYELFKKHLGENTPPKEEFRKTLIEMIKKGKFKPKEGIKNV